MLVTKMGLLKTLLEKEKMLVTSSFLFSHYVFYSINEKLQHSSHTEIVVHKCFELEGAKILSVV